MGGYGSGRWGFHNGKQTVDSSKRLSINSYTQELRMIAKGEWTMSHRIPTWSNQWTHTSSSIGLTFQGDTQSVEALLRYTTTNQVGEKTERYYRVKITYTLTPWGARRYWWNCPRCGQRCGTLYMPPGATIFACRSCHDLTYQSCLDSHESNMFMDELMAAAGCDMSTREFYAFLKWEANGRKLPPPKGLRPMLARAAAQHLEEWEKEQQVHLQRIQARIDAEAAAKVAKYDRYLTPAELCKRSRLTATDLAALATARLLLPDHEGKYRPKLESWAGKLSYLLRTGWNIETIRRWAAERWNNPNPRAWPPDRALYKSSE